MIILLVCFIGWIALSIPAAVVVAWLLFGHEARP